LFNFVLLYFVCTAEKKRYADESKQSAVPNGGTHGASNGGSTVSSFNLC